MDDGPGFESLPSLFCGDMIRDIEVGTTETVNLPAWRPSRSGLYHVAPNQPRSPGDDDTWSHGASLGTLRVSGNRVKQTIRRAGRSLWSPGHDGPWMRTDSNRGLIVRLLTVGLEDVMSESRISPTMANRRGFTWRKIRPVEAEGATQLLRFLHH